MLLPALTCVLALAACSGGDDAGHDAGHDGGHDADVAPYPSGAAGTTLASWPTYHHDPSRSGHVTAGPHGRLRPAWRRSLSGAVYGEPLVIGSTLVVATEHDDVYGLNARTGARRWKAHLGTPQPLSGLPCGNIDPLGITGTPAYDAANGSLFVVAETTGGNHTLWALDPKSGARRWHRSLDTQPDRDKLAEQQRSALLVTAGRVVTVFGGLAGDCADYVGYATSVATDGSGPTESYVVPTAREGGMWSPPGAVRGTNGNVYVAAGNGAERGGTWDGSDSVTELTPSTLQRRSVFAPSTWADDNRGDLDLGSSSPAVVSRVNRMVIAGKRGVAYLLDPSLGGVGSQVAQLSGCTAFGGPATSGGTVLMPCRGEDSIRALHVGRSSLRWGWTKNGVYASPVIAGSRVYAADSDSGDLVVLRLATGETLARLHVGPLPHFSSECVSGDWVFVPTLAGVVAYRGA